MSVRKAGILIIGNEVLSGKVNDENGYFLCQKFHELGVRVDKITIVSDDVKEIAEEVSALSEMCDIVVTSGGVGPTPDDVTYQAVALAFNRDIQICEELISLWREDPDETEASALKMSSVPEGALILFADVNNVRSPVVVLSNVYMFPGTPSLLQNRFCSLEEHFRGHGSFHKFEIFLSVDECLAIPAMNRTVSMFKEVDIGSYPVIDSPHYETRLTLHSHDSELVSKAHDMLLSLLNPSWILDPSKF